MGGARTPGHASRTHVEGERRRPSLRSLASGTHALSGVRACYLRARHPTRVRPNPGSRLSRARPPQLKKTNQRHTSGLQGELSTNACQCAPCAGVRVHVPQVRVRCAPPLFPYPEVHHILKAK